MMQFTDELENLAPILSAGGGKPDGDQSGDTKRDEQAPSDDQPGYGDDSGEGGESSD